MNIKYQYRKLIVLVFLFGINTLSVQVNPVKTYEGTDNWFVGHTNEEVARKSTI